MMTNQEVIDIATQYETTHPVEDYRFYDWNVWPLIREKTTLDAMVPDHSASSIYQKYFRQLLLKHFHFIRKIRSSFNFTIYFKRNFIRDHIWQKKWEKILAHDTSKNDYHLSSDKDAIIFTLSERRIQSMNGLYEIYADPLIEIMQNLGVSVTAWERGDERYPRASPSAWVSRLINKEMGETPELPKLEEPLWYKDFANFTESILGEKKSWIEIEYLIKHVQKLSTVFEKWFKQTKVKLLISVCWYDPDIMAATLAAKRLGIISVDLQHGVQGIGHDAYYGWEKTPSTAYELVPDVFLCWGSAQAKNLLTYNEAFKQQSKIIIGGNLWLNKWRYSDCSLFDLGLDQLSKQTTFYKKTILISLQPGKEHSQFIINALRHSPDEYLWLLRLHPATSSQERLDLEKKLNSLSRRNFEYKLSSTIALYSLFKIIFAHITGHSTTALEALAFGIPSITFTKNGVIAYKEFIDAGTIFYVENIDNLYQVLENCQTVAGLECKKSVQDYFASSNISENGIHDLLLLAGIKSHNIAK
jgi:hypothetical protein